MKKLGRLVGLMHDMCKATDEFAAYIQAPAGAPSPHPHAPTGAIFAYRAAERAAEKLTAHGVLVYTSQVVTDMSKGTEKENELFALSMRH